MSKLDIILEQLLDDHINDILDIVEDYDSLYEGYTIEELDEEISKLEKELDGDVEELGTSDEQEDIADEQGGEDDEDIEEKLIKKATRDKMGKQDMATRRKAEKNRRKNKAKLKIAKKKRDLKNRAKLLRQKKKNERAPAGKKYNIDGKLVRIKTRR